MRPQFAPALLSTFVLAFALAATAPPAGAAGIQQARELVAKAVQHVNAVGEKQAFADFMDKSKGFIDGELYVFVYQLDGVCLAHGLNGSWVGQNRLDWTDPDGRKPNKEMADQVKAGATSGFVDFKFKNPVSGNVEPKVAVFQRVPGKDFFIGSGVYRR